MLKISYFTILFIFLIIISFLIYNHPKFGRLPKGDRLERIKKSPNYRNGKFQNQSITRQLTGDKNKISTMCEFLFQKKEYNNPNYPVNSIKSDLHSIPSDINTITWFGHSSYLIQTDNKKILVDPVFYEASPVSFINKPFIGTDIFKAEDIPDIDYLIITHDHWDHLDFKTVTKLRNRINKIICPLGVGEHFEKWNFNPDSIIELDWNDSTFLDNSHTIHCLPARHFSGRGLKSNQSLWASFMITSKSKSIYISGDGGYDNHFKSISERFKNIDLAIMENGQYNENWKYIHLMPEDLEKAVTDINAKFLITGHNSKFALSNHCWNEPIDNIIQFSVLNNINLMNPIIGEILEF